MNNDELDQQVAYAKRYREELDKLAHVPDTHTRHFMAEIEANKHFGLPLPVLKTPQASDRLASVFHGYNVALKAENESLRAENERLRTLLEQTTVMKREE